MWQRELPLFILVGFWLIAGVKAAAAETGSLSGSYLRNYAETRGFMLGRPAGAMPSPDGQTVLFLRAQPRSAQQSLYIFDTATGKSRELLTPDQVLKGTTEHLSAEEKARRERQRISVGGFTDFQISDDSAKILVSLSGKLYVVTRSDGSIQQLDTGSQDILDPKFSPDSSSVSYIRNHDLFVLDLDTNKSRQVTSQGNEKLTHGLAEFVAQEEMDRFSGYWWSPDSRFIAYEEADASGVELWNLSSPEHPEQPSTPDYYPRPGKPNVKTRVGVVPCSGGKTVWLDWSTSVPDSQHHSYEYLAGVNWPKNGPLTLTVLTRDQKELSLLEADPTTGKTTVLLIDNDKDWINLFSDTPHWLDDGSGFLWISERNGGPQLELRDRKGLLSRVIVGPESGFRSFVDATTNGDIYYEASVDPLECQVFRTSLKSVISKGIAANGPPVSVALTKESGIHSARFSKNHRIYVETASLRDAMPSTSVHRLDGSILGLLPSVAEDPPQNPRVEFIQLAGKPEFHACLVRPTNFDPKRRYPTLIDVYGGPGKNKVVATRRAFLLDQWLADQGFIVVSLDGRGTPGRGRDWERGISHHFGSVPLDDQVAGIEELTRKFPELDKDRVGITGWSFGGYMSALAVLRRPDVFKAAVAGAPVVDWFDYDSCYTERYLGLPKTCPEAYTEASLLTYAAGLKRPLLLVHGTTDDNVFFRHSLKLADALFRAGREFEILPLCGFTHMVADPVVMEQLWLRIAGYFHKHLGAI